MKSSEVYKIFEFCLVAALLQSCFAAKEYSSPDVVHQQYYRTDSLPEDSLTMADISWKEMFTDSLLVGYIEEGLENNIDIRVALQQIRKAEAYYKQGKQGQLPTLNVNASVDYQVLSKNSQFGSFFNETITQYELSAGLSWEADIWGKIRSQKRAFEARYLQSVASHKAVKTRLISEIASLYYQLLSLDEQLRITQRTVANRDTSLRATAALKEAGNLTGVAVKQTEAQYQSARALEVQTKKRIKVLENSLSILRGKAPASIARDSLSDISLPVHNINTGYPVQLLRNRPDVMAAEQNLVNAFELTNVARSRFYPSLSISPTGGLRSLDIDELFSANSLFANVVGNLAQPVLQGRQIRTQFEAAKSDRQIAYLDFRQTILKASKEVSDAIYNIRAANKRVDIKQKEFTANDKAIDYSEQLLKGGLANYLEVLTARQNALQTRLELVQANYSRLNNVVELYRALGGGWR